MTDAEIGKFAHDMNNILTAIVSTADLIRASVSEDSDLRQDTDDLLSAAEQGIAQHATDEIARCQHQHRRTERDQDLGVVEAAFDHQVAEEPEGDHVPRVYADETLQEKLKAFKRDMAEKVAQKAEKLEDIV